MNVLLVAVNAKYIHSNPAVHSLAAYARQAGFAGNLEIAEYTINEPREQILRDIFGRNPDVIGLSCYIWNIETIRFLLPELHKVLPDAKLWLGGPEVSYHPDKVAEEFPFLAGIMLGEGEKLFSDILSEYTNGTLSLCDPSEVMIREASTLLNMDDLPFIYEPFEDLSSSPFANKILYYESSRGCPFRCAYCLSSIDKSTRFRSLPKVISEIDFFLRRNVPQVKFIDRTFNADPARALTIWEYISAHDNGITNFHFEIAGDILTDAQIDVLNAMRPGLVQLEIGVQTTNPETLEAIHRRTDYDVISEHVRKLQKNRNIHLHLDLIAGLPYETFERFTRSFDDLYALSPNELQLGFLKVLHGTELEDQAETYGISHQDTAPYEVLSTKWISFGELVQLKEVEEVLELYHNSQQFSRTLNFVVPLFPRPFVFFEALAKYYKDHGLLMMQSSRSYRYEALYAFLNDVLPDSSLLPDRLLRQLLTFDYLLRERPKKVLSFFHQKEYLSFRYAVWEDGAPALPKERTVSMDYEHRDPVTGNGVKL